MKATAAAHKICDGRPAGYFKAPQPREQLTQKLHDQTGAEAATTSPALMRFSCDSNSSLASGFQARRQTKNPQVTYKRASVTLQSNELSALYVTVMIISDFHAIFLLAFRLPELCPLSSTSHSKVHI